MFLLCGYASFQDGSVSTIVVTVLLLSVSEAISECPPSSGKTLDVYNNNCIGYYRYLPDA